MVKLIPRFNFTNVLHAAFTLADPKSAIKLLNLTVFFALLGSASAKAARRMLMKLTLAWIIEHIRFTTSEYVISQNEYETCWQVEDENFN